MPKWLYDQRVAEGATDFATGGMSAPLTDNETAKPTGKSLVDEGNAALEGGSYKLALESFNNAISLAPKYYDAWLGKALALYGEGRYLPALNAFNEALSIKSSGNDVWNAYGGKAQVLYDLNRFPESVTTFEKAISYYEKSGSTDDSAYNNLVDGLSKAQKAAGL